MDFESINGPCWGAGVASEQYNKLYAVRSVPYFYKRDDANFYREICMVDVLTQVYKKVAQHTHYKPEVVSLALSHDARLYSATATSLCAWDTRTYEPLCFKRVWHPVDIRSLALSPDGTRLVVGLDNHTIFLYDASTLTLIRHWMCYNDLCLLSLVYSPCGRYWYTQSYSYGSNVYDINVWESGTYRHIHTMQQKRYLGEGSGMKRVCVLTKDGRYLYSKTNVFISIWDMMVGVCLYVHIIPNFSGVGGMSLSMDDQQMYSWVHEYSSIWDTRHVVERGWCEDWMGLLA